jgi:hypothetical protein
MVFWFFGLTPFLFPTCSHSNSIAPMASLHCRACTATANLASSTLFRSTLYPLKRIGRNTMKLSSPEYHPSVLNRFKKLFTLSTALVLTQRRSS